MNQEKIGLFIKTLREEQSMTQDELAKKVFRGRDAVSKWERGKNLPDTETLLILSDIFDISVNEILVGERNTSKDITLDLYNDRNKLIKKIKKVTIIAILIIFLGMTGFLTYYFINQYKTVHAYTITGETDSFNIMNGLLIKTNNKLYFSIGNIVSLHGEKIEKIGLYYVDIDEEKLICDRYSSEMFLIDYKGYGEYFNFKKIDLMLKNLYLKIYYNNKIETTKLNVVEDYVNDNLIFPEDYKVSLNQESLNKTNTELLKTIESRFKKTGDNYEYKVNDGIYKKVFTFISINNSLTFTVFKEEEIIEEYVYYLDTNLISYSNYSESKLNYSFNYFKDEYQCTFGECKNYGNKINALYIILEKILLQ